MRKYLKAIGLFVYAVVTRVAAYMTGGIVAAAVFIYEHYNGKAIPMDAVYWGATAFCVVACFLAWKQQFDNVEKHQVTLNDNGRRAERAAVLNEVFNKTREIREARAMSEEEYQKWKDRITEHLNWIQEVLNGKVSEAEINVLIKGPGGPRLSFRGSFGFEENDLNNYLHYLEGRISNLIEKYT